MQTEKCNMQNRLTPTAIENIAHPSRPDFPHDFFPSNRPRRPTNLRCVGSFSHKAGFSFFLLVIFTAFQIAFADDPPAAAPPAKPAVKQKLLERRPFDVVILTKAAGGSTLEVQTISLPQRPLTTLPKSGLLKVRVLDRPTEDFEIGWTSVAQVKVYEQQLMEEGLRLSAAGEFDEAYDYFGRLRVDYPNMPGLEDAISDYLQRNAIALFQAKQQDRALALLLSLYQRNPTYAGLPSALETVAGEIIQRYLREGNYAAARQVLDMWQTKFNGVAAQAATGWQQRFEAAASKQLADASRMISQKQYVPARKAVSRALAIWPTLETAPAVLNQIATEFPFVTVGVLEASPHTPTRRIDDWATLRTSRLTQRLIAQEVDFGTEGGVYHSPFGEFSLDESGRDLSFKLNPATADVTVDTLSRFLLSMAVPGTPFYRPDFASLLGSVSIEHDSTVAMHLRRVHVRPEAMLQVPPPGAAANLDGAYSVAAYAPGQVVFAFRDAGARASGPQAIVEQTMTSDEAALSALQVGEVDILDRVPPWQITRLQQIQDVHVSSYKLPTVHVLIPNLKNPLLAKREFRRALCFGIDRKWIVDRILLGGGAMQGYQAISGPFPAGASLNDPSRYGYNDQVAVRPFEPRLATILATVAWNAVQNPTGKDNTKPTSADIPQLILAHPNDPIARVASQTIQAQLSHEGIPIKLREFTADELAAGKVEYDLRYAEITVGEPLTDARTLLGPTGLAGDVHSTYLDAALRDLDAATNWKDVRSRLCKLHEIASHELPVIPLWQTINYFAYRNSVHGIEDSPIALYQSIGQWSLTPTTAKVATTNAPQP
jgi:tetratricopeptide (TPR) repeat protein